jgi:predicted MPP superfamily phosphohydrolase
MRTFQLLFILLFLVFYAFLTFGSLKSLLGISKSQNKGKVKIGVLLFTAVIFVGFILLYIWPLTTRNTNEYSAHLIFNAILSIDFIFKLPLALSYVFSIFFSIKRKPVIYYIGLLLSTGIALSVLHGTLAGTKNLVVNHIHLRFQNLPPHFSGYKIMQISDTHLGNFLKSKILLKKVLETMENENPNAIFFTGDLVNNFKNEIIGYEDLFQNLTKGKESFSILGNHDYGDYTDWESEKSKVENFEHIVSAHSSFGFRILNNEHAVVKQGTDSIFVIGVENWGHPPFPQYANLDSAMRGIPENSFKILLTHDPAHWDEIIKYRKDIPFSLSGHTHGLQWGIKKAGITFSLSYLTRNNWGGLYEFEQSKLYVNTGLGTVGMIWRINMPPEVTIITLQGMEIN